MSISTATKQAGAATSQPGKAWVLLAVSLGQFLIQLDLTIVNVALPAIGRDLGTSVSGLQWVVDGYSVAVASLLLVGGRIGDRSGHKRVYLAGVLVFALGSALCAAAPTAGALVAFRVLQGVGAAIELPATLAILTHTFTGARERAQAVGIWASAAGSSLVIGPVLGGGLVAAFGWRAVFLVNLPVTVAIGVLVGRTVRETPQAAGGGLDLPGQLLGSAALGLLAAGAIEGGKHGFAAALPLGLFADTQPGRLELELGEGDVLFFYTDGVTEARSADLSFFEDRLADALAAVAGRSASDIVRAVQELVTSFSSGELKDDVTILAVRVT